VAARVSTDSQRGKKVEILEVHKSDMALAVYCTALFGTHLFI
jgi:hypothetical protein